MGPETKKHDNDQTNKQIACVASVSVQFRRKERGTRVKDREKSSLFGSRFSHCQQQQACSGPRSPGQSNSTFF